MALCDACQNKAPDSIKAPTAQAGRVNRTRIESAVKPLRQGLIAWVVSSGLGALGWMIMAANPEECHASGFRVICERPNEGAHTFGVILVLAAGIAAIAAIVLLIQAATLTMQRFEVIYDAHQRALDTPPAPPAPAQPVHAPTPAPSS